MVHLLSFLWGAFLVFITILALGNLLFPRKLWKLFDAWKARTTPSPGYFFHAARKWICCVHILYRPLVSVLPYKFPIVKQKEETGWFPLFLSSDFSGFPSDGADSHHNAVHSQQNKICTGKISQCG